MRKEMRKEMRKVSKGQRKGALIGLDSSVGEEQRYRKKEFDSKERLRTCTSPIE